MAKRTEMWEFKYQPTKFEDMILDDVVKAPLLKNLEEKNNIMLVGPPGTGKGTYTDIYAKHTGMDVLKLNCSDETGVDSIRDKVKSFAQAFSMNGLKLVYLNECDYLSPNAQAMLRDLMESVQKLTRFVLCCNYQNKIIEELESRCNIVHLNNPPAADVVRYLWGILDAEKVTYNKKVVVEMVKTIWKNRPDIRKAIKTLQWNVSDGQLSNNIIINSCEDTYEAILAAMKEGDPEATRKVLKSNVIDYTALYAWLFDVLFYQDNVFSNDGKAIRLVGEYQHKDVTNPLKEINFMAMYFEMLANGVI